MAEKVASLYAEIGLDASKLEAGLTRSKAGLTRFGSDFNSQFLSGLARGEASTKAFGNELLQAADKAGLSTTEIRKMAGATGLFTTEQLRAGQASANVAAKAQELSQAVKNGTMTTRDAGVAFQAYAKTQAVATKSALTMQDAVRGVGIAIAVGTGVVMAGKAAYEATIAPTVRYAQQMREMAAFTGMTTEETQRLVQVADDWKISADQVRTSMALLAKNGIDPSIDSLAALADRFVETGGGATFAAEASKLLGRNWTSLIPILQNGGKALRDQAAAIDKNLILTDQQIAQAREYELALDNLQDKWTGLTYTIGKVAVPLLTQALTPAMEREIDLSQVMIREVDGVRKAFVRQGNGLRDVTDQYNLAHGAVGKFAREDLTAVAQNADIATLSLEEMLEAEDRLAQRTLDLTDTFSGLVRDTDDFRASQKEVSDELYETNKQISILEGKKYLTNAQKQQLEELKTKQKELQDEYRLNAEAHEEATNRIIFDIQTQVLAMDGLTAAEADLLLASAEGMGLVDAASAEAARKINDVMAQVQSGAMSAEDAIRRVKTILDSLKSKTITVKIKYTSEGAVLPSGEIANATGGHYDVPASAGSEGWHFTAGAGEHVDVWTAQELNQAKAGWGVSQSGIQGIGSMNVPKQPSTGGGGNGGMLYIANQTIIVGSGDPDAVVDAVIDGNLKSGASLGFAG